ncbi:uncharacterized protein G2W53_027591 [Senna tora]|uniref:Uncharacterized protein n=1 Tax=Senna tora TaxID=362788 RepID=A0A834TJB5_9FABA|nr:uncharacterized protein G2W53_027591 [Senna tora]
MEDLEDCTVGEISINGRVETQWKASMDALEHDSGMGTRRSNTKENGEVEVVTGGEMNGAPGDGGVERVVVCR